MPEVKTANKLNFNTNKHKTCYVSGFTNKDCGKRKTLDDYDRTMFITTLNLLHSLKHRKGYFASMNFEYDSDCSYKKHLDYDNNQLLFESEFYDEDGSPLYDNIYQYLGMEEIEEPEPEEIIDDISEEAIPEESDEDVEIIINYKKIILLYIEE